MNSKNLTEIEITLNDIEQSIELDQYFPAVKPGASRFALNNPYAFLIATCLDRGARSEIIWCIPFELKAALGHLDVDRVAAMTRSDLDAAIRGLAHKPRYIQSAPDTILQLSRLIVNEHGGDAMRLWRNRNAQQFKADLRGIRGVGPGIADMAVQLVRRAYGEAFAGSDLRSLTSRPTRIRAASSFAWELRAGSLIVRRSQPRV